MYFKTDQFQWKVTNTVIYFNINVINIQRKVGHTNTTLFRHSLSTSHQHLQTIISQNFDSKYQIKHSFNFMKRTGKIWFVLTCTKGTKQPFSGSCLPL